LKVARADGVALLANGHVHSFGYAPEQDAIRRLDAWLDKRLDAEAGTHSGDEIFHSDHLGAELPWTTEIAAVASGLLSTRISSVRTRRLLWFRREVVETVNWAGKPPSEDEAKSLTPRHSFEIWKETARGSAQPWSEQELESARNFSAAITILGLRSAEEDIELGEARFEQLTAALPAKVFAADDTGCLTYTNERWYQQVCAAAVSGLKTRPLRRRSVNAPLPRGRMQWLPTTRLKPSSACAPAMVRNAGTSCVRSRFIAKAQRAPAGSAPSST
jgi:PAS domain-containing protein